MLSETFFYFVYIYLSLVFFDKCKYLTRVFRLTGGYKCQRSVDRLLRISGNIR